MVDHTNIAVVESRWWENGNTSVRGLFELIADINCDNPHAYHYEMVGCEAAAKEAIPRIATIRSCRYLCVATHGDEDGLMWHNGDRLTRSEIRNLLTGIEEKRGSRLDGLHMSSCGFGTSKLADFLFQKEICLWWISGYSKDVDFVTSSSLDLLFFNELISRKYSPKETAIQAIERTAERLSSLVPGMINELGFGIYVRRQKSGGAKDLLEHIRD